MKHGSLQASCRFLNQCLNFETYDTQREASFEDGCYLVGQAFSQGVITVASCQASFFRQADQLRPSQQTSNIRVFERGCITTRFSGFRCNSSVKLKHKWRECERVCIRFLLTHLDYLWNLCDYHPNPYHFVSFPVKSTRDTFVTANGAKYRFHLIPDRKRQFEFMHKCCKMLL